MGGLGSKAAGGGGAAPASATAAGTRVTEGKDLGDREGAHVVTAGTKEERALLLAAGGGDAATVERLIKAKVNVNFGIDLHNTGTPLTEAAKGGHSAVVAALLRAGASVAGVDGSNATALHYAARKQDEPMLRALLEHSSCTRDVINTRDNAGRTALHFVAQRGNGALCALLVGAGADASIKDGKGATPRAVARADALTVLGPV
jgi:ankyrin repeat protein